MEYTSAMRKKKEIHRKNEGGNIVFMMPQPLVHARRSMVPNVPLLGLQPGPAKGQ
jgi:hypothetical protein